MSEKTLIGHCSMTLAGMKTGNLFVCLREEQKEVENFLLRINKVLNPRGVHAMILAVKEKRIYIYVYRPYFLEEDLHHKMAQEILTRRGYPKKSLKAILQYLGKQIETMSTFPHEIGLFLGYPVEDVIGYILHGGKESQGGGYWKVYDHLEKKKELFAKYKKCARIYEKKHQEGISLEQLTVHGKVFVKEA